jgi:hypothetical protein
MSQLLALLAFAVVACLALSWPADRDGSDISVIAAHDGFLRPKENWILNDDTCMGLLNLRGRIEYAKERASGSLSQPEVDEFFRESLLREHEIWKQIRDRNPQERPADPRGIAKTGIWKFLKYRFNGRCSVVAVMARWPGAASGSLS